MLNKEILKLLNEQVNKEFFSAYLYLDFANYYSDVSLEGFENWFSIQAQEERDHALLFRQYILDNSEKVYFTELAAPNDPAGSGNYADYREPLALAFEHEVFITNSINKIYEVAHDINDFRTMQFLNWFIQEQMEEEKNADDNLSKYDLFTKESKGLYNLDNEMKARVYVAPSLVL